MSGFAIIRSMDRASSTLWSLAWTFAIGGIDIARIATTHQIDVPAIGAMIIAMAPAIRHFARSAEFDLLKGKMKIEAVDVRQAVHDLAAAPVPKVLPKPDVIDANFRALPPDTMGLVTTARGVPQPTNYYEIDPNIGLVNLRIEIEKRLAQVAELYDVRYPAPLGRIVDELARRQVFSPAYADSLKRLISFGNAAAHGAEVAPEAARIAEDAEPDTLRSLDELIDRILRQFKTHDEDDETRGD